MFIEVTRLSDGKKSVLNTKYITSIGKEGSGSEMFFIRYHLDKEVNYVLIKESYEDIKTLLNAKWVAE